MKKLLAKIRRTKPSGAPLTRITNETVAEHRERILAGGRRFKYPLQYARHKLVINAIIISVVAVILIIVIGWWQLYSVQNTSTFVYRVTKVLPLPVASVDGQPVPYGDYLMRYRSAVHHLEQKEQISLKSEDGRRQADYHKQKSMQDSVADAYAIKLANELNLIVSDAEVEASLKLQRQSSTGEISQQTYDASILDILGWSADEYRYILKYALLRQKVAYAVDDNALKVSDSIAEQLSTPDVNLQVLAEAATASGGSAVSYGASGWVPKTNRDGGLAKAASKLEKGQISPVIKSTTGEGYYFVRLLESNDTQVSYEYIQVPLTEFASRLVSLEKSGKITYYISIPKTVAAQ